MAHDNSNASRVKCGRARVNETSPVKRIRRSKEQMQDVLSAISTILVRAAVTEEQIQELNLPTRPTKQSDTRAKKWTGGECVELDSMPPDEIRQLVKSSIIRHINVHEWQMLQKTEGLERETLRKIWRKAA